MPERLALLSQRNSLASVLPCALAWSPLACATGLQASALLECEADLRRTDVYCYTTPHALTALTVCI